MEAADSPRAAIETLESGILANLPLSSSSRYDKSITMGHEPPFSRCDPPKKKILLWTDAINDDCLLGPFSDGRGSRKTSALLGLPEHHH